MTTKRQKKIIPKKTPMPEQDPAVRRRNFNEAALGYTPSMAMQEAERCLQCDRPQCVMGCPVHVPVPRFIKAISEGDFRKALRIIKEANLLPAVCGRVCPQETQCEKHCALGKKFEPVAIGALERFAADQSASGDDGSGHEPAPKTGRSVAVIGSGPSGLACAYDLSRLGHSVVIHEALHEPGGVLIYGIPEFRLPKEIVAREIDALRRMDVTILTNSVAGRLVDIDEIMSRFDACYIATGAGLPKFLGIEGENMSGVYSANEFLTRVNLMRAYRFPEYDTPIKKGNRVVVVGGGNVAMDAARTAVRLGAEDVVLVYRRSLEELPARRDEVHHAQEEGVHFELCTNPVRIIGKDGVVSGVECVRMDLCEPDESGRRRPRPVKGSEFVIHADKVIIAVGTEANPLLVRSASGISITKKGYIETDEETGRTSREGVYAGGDIVTGSATVISAMGAGRRVAKAIHDFLSRKKA